MVSDAPGTLYVVATPIGNLEDISRRALDTLAAVDLVAAEDTRHSGRLLQHYGIRAQLLALHEHNERGLVAELLTRLRDGASIALISDAGTPLISDPGFPLVSACAAAGIAVVGVPGPCALITALSISGLPTDRFRFEGFLPRKPAARKALLSALARDAATIVLYESSHRIVASLADLVSSFGGDRVAVLARELSKLHETVLRGTLVDLQQQLYDDANQRKGEFVVVIAGLPAIQDDDSSAVDLDRILRILLRELPLKQAVTLAMRITGAARNDVYEQALVITGSD